MRTKMMTFAVGSQYQAVNELSELQDVYGLFMYDFCVGYISCRYSMLWVRAYPKIIPTGCIWISWMFEFKLNIPSGKLT